MIGIVKCNCLTRGNKWLLECEKVTKVMIGIILCILTKNNATAIIISLFVSCMTLYVRSELNA